MHERLKTIVSQLVGREDVTVTDEVDLLTDVGLDSVQLLSLITTLEREFRCTFRDADLEVDNFRSIRAIAALLETSYVPSH